MESIPNHQPPTEAEIEEIKRKNHLQYLKENPTKPPEQKDNTVQIETLHAQYTIVYSNHKVTNNPEDVHGSDVILLEFGGINLATAEKDLNQRIEDQRDFNQQYSEIIKYAAEHSIPIYIPDTHKNVESELVTKGFLLPLLETYISYRLVKSSIEDSIEKPMTRRSFLKNLGKAAAAAYFSTPIIEPSVRLSFNEEPNESSVGRKVQRQVSQLNDLIHPELNSMVMHGRNSLIAMKAERIAKDIESKLGRKPKISLVMGAAHIGIEDTLRMSDEQRMQELKKYLSEQEIKDEGTIFHIEWDNKKPVVSRT